MCHFCLASSCPFQSLIILLLYGWLACMLKIIELVENFPYEYQRILLCGDKTMQGRFLKLIIDVSSSSDERISEGLHDKLFNLHSARLCSLLVVFYK